MLHGLIARPDLNGQVGELIQFFEETGRWEVLFPTGERANIKLANFIVQPLSAVASGTRNIKKRSPRQEAPIRRTRMRCKTAEDSLVQPSSAAPGASGASWRRVRLPKAKARDLGAARATTEEQSDSD